MPRQLDLAIIVALSSDGVVYRGDVEMVAKSLQIASVLVLAVVRGRIAEKAMTTPSWRGARPRLVFASSHSG